MEHHHDVDFCLTCALKEITPLLPHQGPIKDFIHQNTLQVFLDKPFHEAIDEGAKVYGARTYMNLSFYRGKYARGEIGDACLKVAMAEQFGALAPHEAELIRDAMANFVEIIDDRTLQFLLNQHKVAPATIRTTRERLTRLRPAKTPSVSLRKLLNDRLGCQIDHDVNAIFFRLLGSYLDQGVILWPLLDECPDFRSAVVSLVSHSAIPIANFVDNQDMAGYLAMPCDVGVDLALRQMFSSPSLYARYIKESLLHHPGWSGMINVVAHHPGSLGKPRNITVEEALLVKLALEWQFISNVSDDFVPISPHDVEVAERLAQATVTRDDLSLQHWLLTSSHDALALPDALLAQITLQELQKTWHQALELHYYNEVAEKFTTEKPAMKKAEDTVLQAVFCIDDRECSFRRHLEAENPKLTTFGFPGFFGIEFYFKPHKRDLMEKMCPAPVTPKYVVMEREKVIGAQKKNRKLFEFASFISRHGANSIFFGFVSAYTLGHLSAFRLFFSFFQPVGLLRGRRQRVAEENTTLIFERSDEHPMHRGLLLGFTHEEMAQRVFTALRNMGLATDFAPVVFLIAHGSSSVNNPHFAAYDCGACSGRPGGINARLFAAMANIANVRRLVKELGITIPDDTVFVGALHDTCTDDVQFFDTEKLSPQARTLVKAFGKHIAQAQVKNAQERCRRFALVPKDISPKNALKEVRHRSRALFEPRPELGHATNALCIVGRRERSYGKNFDRRAFLQSYDPTKDDSGQILGAIMSAVIPVCGGINLEYFFSRVDPAVYGCGTKLSHNVCSLIGVGNGLDDDLRTGLPIQMTEIHDPVRLLIVIEQTPEIIARAVLGNQLLAPWILNDWLKIASLDPYGDHLSFFDHRRQAFCEPLTARG